MSNKSPVEKWIESFQSNAFMAVNNLLMSRVYMGYLNPNDTCEIFYLLFTDPNKLKDQTLCLDETLQKWFQQNWNYTPRGVSQSHWCEILRNAFSTTRLLKLEGSAKWLKNNYSLGQKWLRELKLAESRDPLADLESVLRYFSK